ncbi:MAG: 2-oxoacid:acceptor oxidoreductase family protein [Lachnospiraceae bacterium]|jgi:2-oxoglutarate ferredoxin oxidoreductase subunit gamma|nr:2-oxoacid:acceptor oxidoreductase family protein [Lachnospiraceae bacterium]
MKSKDCNMIFAGFGGQGILFSGKVMAYAGLIDDKEVSWLPSYGPEMRGGTANCSVCISDEPVGSPLVVAPDVLVVMNKPSYDKFIDSVVPGGKVFVDSSLVELTGEKRKDIEIYELPATKLSNEEHLEGIANMILLGKMADKVGIVPMEAVLKAVEKCVPARKAHLLEHNKRAIELGANYAD